MRRIRVLLMSVMAMLSIVAVAQDEALLWAEQLPQFPGGTNALAESIAANITYPDNCPSFDSKVIVQFVVTKTGDIGEVKVSRSVDPVLDSIAIAAVKKLPQFIPGQQDGKPVDVWFSLPISFKSEVMTEDEMENPVNNLDTALISTAQMPEFPGGEQGLKDFISKNLRYPKKAANNHIQGRVVVQFVVKKTGEIGEIKIVESVDPLLDAEAARVCSILPKFKPAMENGEPVSVWYTLPFNFKLESPSLDPETEYLFSMGARYLFGLDGVPRDKSLARDFLKRAAMRGHPEARKLLQQIN